MWLDLALVLSGPSLYDRAAIEPSLYQVFSNNSCATKLKTLEQRGIKDGKQRLLKECAKHKLHAQTEDFEYWKCGCQFMHPMVGTYLNLATQMKNGILPYEGGYLDQPVVIMEMISLVQTFLHEEEERQRKKQEQAQKNRRK